MSSPLRERMTLLELVQVVQREARSDEEIVERVTRLINTGIVTLCGNFAGCRI